MEDDRITDVCVIFTFEGFYVNKKLVFKNVCCHDFRNKIKKYTDISGEIFWKGDYLYISEEFKQYLLDTYKLFLSYDESKIYVGFYNGCEERDILEYCGLPTKDMADVKDVRICHEDFIYSLKVKME